MKEEIEDEKENNINKGNIKDENNFETDLLKYNFDYTTKFKSCNINERQKNKLLLNFFLMSSKINIFNKIICLTKLYDISNEEQNFQMIYNITYKIIKYLKYQRIPNQYIDMSNLFSYDFLSDLQNYYYAFKSLNDIKKLTMKDVIDNYLYKEIKDFIIKKIEDYKTIFINILKEGNFKNISDTINKILNENKEKDKNINVNNKDNNIIKINECEDQKEKVEDNITENIINTEIINTENKIEDNNINKEVINGENKIIENNINIENDINSINSINDEDIVIENKIIENKVNEIFDINKIEINNVEENKNEKKEIEKNTIISNDFIDESEETQQIKSQYLYAINKNWLKNAKQFIENYLFAKETGLLNDFFNESFEPGYALAAFLLNGIISTPQNYTYFPFPGPINNFPLTSFKEQWIDPINIEENDIIEKDLVNGKDYFLIDYNDWKILQNAFGFTNILIRTKDNIDMIQIGINIFDQRFKMYKNDDTNLFKKKVIQIGKNAFIYEFIAKINRSIEYEIAKIKFKKNKKTNIKNNKKNIDDINN